MNLNTENAQTIIERDVHCPYCDSDKALLISEIAEKSLSFAEKQEDLRNLRRYCRVYGTQCQSNQNCNGSS